LFISVLNHNDFLGVLNLPPRFLLVATHLNISSLSPGAPAFQFLQQSTARGSNPVSFLPRGCEKKISYSVSSYFSSFFLRLLLWQRLKLHYITVKTSGRSAATHPQRCDRTL
jgi:hypothetical protein